MRTRQLLLALGFAVLAAAALAADWPGFRGPHGTGVAEETGVPVSWGPDENIRWKVALEGPGNGSPIVSGGLVFVTSTTDEGRRRSLHCFDRKDGSHRWTQTINFEGVDPTHRTNNHAPTTPAADSQRVVVWHGSAGLYCYDLEGRPLWSTDLGDFIHIWGFGASPVIYRDRVIVHCGPGENTFLAAVDLKSGEVLWKTEEPGGESGLSEERRGGWIGSWSTPVITKVDGQDQVLCSMPTRVVAYDPKNGKILWYVEGLANMPRGNLVYTSLLIGDGIGVAMGGFSGPTIGFKLGGSGNMTEKNVLWRHAQGPQRIGSGVILDGYVYIANAGPSTIECLDAQTGKEQWRARAPGANHWGSLVYADGRLYVTDQNGTTHVFRPNPKEFELIASNQLGEPTNSTPAISDGQIFIRTQKHLFCIGEDRR